MKTYQYKKIVDEITTQLNNDRKFASIIEARAVVSGVLGIPVKPGTAEAKLVDELIERAVIKAAQVIVGKGESKLETFRQLVNLYQRQPILSSKSSDSVAKQAYSTPVPIGYLIGVLAGITSETTVYEPTAGNGALLLLANPKLTHANEIDDFRAEWLEQLGYFTTREDAVYYNPGRYIVDVAIANPPFGKLKIHPPLFDRFVPQQIDQAIALMALQTIKPQGNAALILAGCKVRGNRSNAYNSFAKRSFYYYLYNSYNVIHHVTIDGELYSRQGAGYPIDLIAIEGIGKSDLPLPAVSPPAIYTNFQDLETFFN